MGMDFTVLFSNDIKCCFSLLDGPDGYWKHVQRDSLRARAFQEVVFTGRHDVQGISGQKLTTKQR